MFKPLALFIGLRYTRTRKKNYLVSFVSLVSMLGITLGVLALIAVLSVINGSTTTMREETLKSVPHASISMVDDALEWPARLDALQTQPGVLGVAPYIEGEAWARYEGRAEFLQVRGISPGHELDVVNSENVSLLDLLTRMQPAGSGIILGTQLAARMGLYTGDTISVTPLNSLVSRQLQDVRNFTVLGVADFGFYGNANTALVHLNDAALLFGTRISADAPDSGNSAYALRIRVRVDDVFNAGRITRNAAAASGIGLMSENTISTWQQTQGSLFDALRLEKTLTGFMLLMIVVIGAVNIVSTLVMVVADKSADIAILRTMGASKLSIMAIFITQGAAVGIIGTAIGALLGVLLANNIDGLTRWLENILNSGLLNDNVYMISHLRAELQWQDVATVCGCAILVSFIATLYPAYRASRIQPAEVLRYE